MRGVAIPKSRARLSFNILPYCTILSLESWVATSLSATCPVTTPTRSASEARIMSTCSTSAFLARYSVWPGNLNWLLCMVSLLMGAVTSTSTLVAARSCTAASRLSRANSPASGWGWPQSGVGRVGAMSTQCREPGRASAASSTPVMSTCTSNCWACSRRAPTCPYTTGRMSSNIRGSAKAFRMHSDPMPCGSPHVMPIRTGLLFAMDAKVAPGGAGWGPHRTSERGEFLHLSPCASPCTVLTLRCSCGSCFPS